MNRDYLDYKRHNKEINSNYDKRINGMSDKHIGYALFRSVNFNAVKNRFSVFINWDEELNCILEDSMPNSGYYIECNQEEAKEFCKSLNGFSVKGKLYSNEGHIELERIYIDYLNKEFDVMFVGCNVMVPDIELEISKQGCNSKRNSTGSYSFDRQNLSSFNVSRFVIGSFVNSSFNYNSFSIGSFVNSSFNYNSFSLGSFVNSSSNYNSFSINSLFTNSFNLSSFNQGSFSLSNFSILEKGSFYLQPRFDIENTAYVTKTVVAEDLDFDVLLDYIFGVGHMGYGLNLI